MMYHVSKYAATKGITSVVDPELTNDTKGRPVVDYNGKFFLVGKDCFESLDDARRDAIKRTRRKVSALFAKEGKLEALIEQWEVELPS